MAGHLAHWRARARDPRSTGTASRRYAWNRVGAIQRPYLSKVASCGVLGAAVRCGCGVSKRPYTCRRHLVCLPCLKSRSKRMRARIRESLEWHVRSRFRGSRAKCSLRMLTLTWRHSGDPGADRRGLADAWRRFYKAYNRKWGWFPYVGVWEVTTGSDGLGHPHAHVVVQWPWRDYHEIRRMWRVASTTPDGVLHSEQPDIKMATDSRDASEYIGKYVSKGFTTDDWTDELRALVAAGTYNTRWVFTSVRFWRAYTPHCPCCAQPFRRDSLTVGQTWRSAESQWPLAGRSRWNHVPDPTPDDWGGDRRYQVNISAFSEAVELSSARAARRRLRRT
jgi:hypothetical protein